MVLPDFRQWHSTRRRAVAHIQDHLGTAEYILVSSHQVVRDALREAEISYTLSGIDPVA